MTDIVERLRNVDLLDDFARLEAAVEIERLREQDDAWITTVRKQEEELVRLRGIRAATIEECAQKVIRSGIAKPYYLMQLADELRALKEQP